MPAPVDDDFKLSPDLEQQVDIDGQGVMVGVQRDRDGRAGNGPQPMDRV